MKIHVRVSVRLKADKCIVSSPRSFGGPGNNHYNASETRSMRLLSTRRCQLLVYNLGLSSRHSHQKLHNESFVAWKAGDETSKHCVMQSEHSMEVFMITTEQDSFTGSHSWKGAPPSSSNFTDTGVSFILKCKGDILGAKSKVAGRGGEGFYTAMFWFQAKMILRICLSDKWRGSYCPRPPPPHRNYASYRRIVKMWRF